MSAFLLLLAKLNLAMAAAVVLVSLLRRPLRLWFGAPIAYAAWFLVPVASMASLLPPRVAAPVIARIAPMPAMPVPPMSVPAMPTPAMPAPPTPVPAMEIGDSALRATGQLTGHSALLPPAIATPPPAYHMPDTVLLLFAAWVLGTVLMALYLTGLQLRFSAAVRRGKAGPAVLGFFRPRIVTPDGFEEYFSPREQAAILAHEHIHLARQDARINALTALLRCLCWFNPFIHLGARWLRIDQELACDASAVAGPVSRSDYAKALLKSQMMVTALPLGCNWPGSRHPLIDRIALLQRKPPGTARRFAGVGLVLLAAGFAGLGAWAAQPPVAAPPARQSSVALATHPAMVAAPGQTARDADLTPPVADAHPISSGNDVGGSKNVRAGGVASSLSAPPSPDLPKGKENLATPTVLASSAPPVAKPGDQPVASTSTAASAVTAEAGARPNLTPNQQSGMIASAAVSSSATNVSGPKTEAGIRCLMGLGAWSCWTMFDSQFAYAAQQDIKYCSEKDWSEASKWASSTAYCPSGPLQSIEYVGVNATGDDIYSVSFMHKNMTYILPQPGPDGKIATRCKFDGPPGGATNGICLGGRTTGASAAKVTSPASPVRILYTRPADGQRSEQASVSASVPAIQPVVVPNTPTGAGDPNAMVCRAPQHMAGSDQLGAQVCLHNSEWWKVAMNGKDIAPDGKTLIDRPTVKYPKGEGDPDAITCRTPQFVWSGPPVKICRLNSFWADVIKSNEVVDARGNTVPRSNPFDGQIGLSGFSWGSGSGDPYHDSGYPSQSSANPGGTPGTP